MRNIDDRTDATPPFGAAALALAAALVCVTATQGAASLHRATARLTARAAAILDAHALLQGVGANGGNAVVERLRKGGWPVVRAGVVARGGVDEFGIARGQRLLVDTAGHQGEDIAGDAELTRAVAQARALAARHVHSMRKWAVALPDGTVRATAVGRDGTVAFVQVSGRAPWNAPTSPWALWIACVVLGALAGWRATSRRWLALVALGGVAAAWIVWLGHVAGDLDTAAREVIRRLNEELDGIAGGSAWFGGTPLVEALLSFGGGKPVASAAAAQWGVAAAAGLCAWAWAPAARVLHGVWTVPSRYAYAAPAWIATIVLVFVPFAAGIGLAFFDAGPGDPADYQFVGLGNFTEILVPPAGASGPSFYFTLGVTLLWTVVNVALHVSIGLALALVLNQPRLRLRGIYRVLLVVPWAVPNYITALIWKGMFHYQYGAINGILRALGLGAVEWFGTSFWTNFAANVITNTWLGFPFMMVVSLGALQSIPSELYEAAAMDGASKWQRFVHVTLPLIKPVLLPAVLLGGIWTFNMFNVVYLVSGGAPDNQTNILITEAFYQFKVLGRYGYAAAYSVLIFGILLGLSAAVTRMTRALEAA